MYHALSTLNKNKKAAHFNVLHIKNKRLFHHGYFDTEVPALPSIARSA